MSSLVIFQRNQLLYVEFGVLYLLLGAAGVAAFWFSPLLLVVAPSFFLLFAGLFLLLDRRKNEDVDFADLVSGNSRELVSGAALSLFMGLCGSVYLSHSGMTFGFFNSLLLLEALNVFPLCLSVLMRRQPSQLFHAIKFSLLVIPICMGTLVLGGVLTVPLLFISSFNTQEIEPGVGTTDESAIPNPRGKKTYSPGEVADIEQRNRQRL